jgi:hypothetical protein
MIPKREETLAALDRQKELFANEKEAYDKSKKLLVGKMLEMFEMARVRCVLRKCVCVLQ